MRRKIHRSSRTSSPVLRRAFRPGANRLEDRTLLSTTPITWANDVSGDWDNPAMWTGGVVPGSGDDAVINFSDITVTHATSAPDTVDGLGCAATLNIASGSLSINTTSPLQPTSTISGQFTLGGASLQLLSGNLDLKGGGTISGTITAAAGTNLARIFHPSSGFLNSAMALLVIGYGLAHSPLPSRARPPR